MKVYKIRSGILIEIEEQFYWLKEEDWDGFINDDKIAWKINKLVSRLNPITHAGRLLKEELLAPVGSQELWACGVTYLRSKLGRQEESKTAGGSDFYAKVYEAERPEIFFKSTPHRIAGPGAKVSIRKDSTWDVPEPELTLMVTSSGKIIGYTIGNDMSSRSIEGENPLYLPQAKTYDGSAAIGPCIYVTEKPLPKETIIHLDIIRNKTNVFEGEVAISQIKRTFEELVSFLYRACSFPHGCLVMTATGIVPGNDFTLKKDDEIRITIEPIGI